MCWPRTKRVGTALRKLKKENKSMGGKGKLTDSQIDKLQNYYGTTIRSSNCGDLNRMMSANYGSFFHHVSSNKRNLYNYCAEGPDSWCRYQKDKANKTKLFKPGPGLPDYIIALITALMLCCANVRMEFIKCWIRKKYKRLLNI